jgi:hypothetical protein
LCYAFNNNTKIRGISEKVNTLVRIYTIRRNRQMLYLKMLEQIGRAEKTGLNEYKVSIMFRVERRGAR